jgi:hypothetical protein
MGRSNKWNEAQSDQYEAFMREIGLDPSERPSSTSDDYRYLVNRYLNRHDLLFSGSFPAVAVNPSLVIEE